MTVHVLFENEAWLPPLEKALADRGLPYELHFTEGGCLDLASSPPEGVFITRMSPSSHTRGHQGGVQHVRDLLYWLEAHGRPVINGSQAFDLELSKVRQDLALRAFDILTPHTMGVVGKDNLKAAARQMAMPFITKHNQGGKGLGVKLFRDLETFDAYVDGPEFIEDPGGVTLLQQYIKPRDEHITRVEIVDGHFVYAMNSSTAEGFELCPAKECAVDGAFCPAGPSDKFTLNREFDANDPLVDKYAKLMKANAIQVAGSECVTAEDGQRYTFDIIGTTNFNADVEAEAGLEGMSFVARLAERLLAPPVRLSTAAG